MVETAEPGISRNIMYALIKLGKLCMIESGKGVVDTESRIRQNNGRGSVMMGRERWGVDGYYST